MSGRFPGARNIEELWEILATGQDMVREIPAERFDWRQYYGDPDRNRGKPIANGAAAFPVSVNLNPCFSRFRPRKPKPWIPGNGCCSRNPGKHWRMPDTGRNRSRPKKSGCLSASNREIINFLPKEKASITSNHNAILASRLAYFLNLNGPVMAIDTACSSGLVAAHQAVLSLRNGECDTAIAAGVNLIAYPGTVYRDESGRDVVGRRQMLCL